MNEQSFVKRHSLGIYFVIAFAISWIGTFIVIGPKFLAGEVIEFRDIGLMAFAMLNGPFIAGLLMTYLTDGKQGLKEFLARLKKYKIPGHWYLPILIFPILLLCVSVLLGVLVSPELAPTLGFMGLIAGPMAGLLEETGWMGFVYPIMKGKSSALTTAIYLGVIHGVWHIVADFLGNSLAFGGYWLPYFFGFCLHVVALRVLIVWVYSKYRQPVLGNVDACQFNRILRNYHLNNNGTGILGDLLQRLRNSLVLSSLNCCLEIR